MSEITPEAVKTAQDYAGLLDTWGEASAATAMLDLATAYRALAEENERLRGREKDLEAEIYGLAYDLRFCRATEGQSHE